MWTYQYEATCVVHQAGPLRDVITEEGSFDKAECRLLQQSEDRVYPCMKLGGPDVTRTLHAQTRPVRAQNRCVTRSGVSQIPEMSPVADV